MPKKAPTAPDVSDHYGFPAVTMTELVLPSHTNALGTIFGGVVMSWIDIAGAIACLRYCRTPVVTLSIDYMHFLAPIKIGYTVIIQAHVSYVGRTSMETEITVESENNITGERVLTTKAYLTYVALDEHGRPKPIPPLQPRNDAERKALKDAEKRRAHRLKAAY